MDMASLTQSQADGLSTSLDTNLGKISVAMPGHRTDYYDGGGHPVMPHSVIGPTSYSDPTPTEKLSKTEFNSPFSTIRLPSDTPPFYFQLSVSEYRRASWREVGDLTPIGKIILPLPASISDEQRVLWEEVPIGLAGLATINGGVGVEQSIEDVWRTAFKGDYGSLGQRMGLEIAEDVAGGFGKGGAAGYMAKNGVAINTFLTMLLKGPTYKTHRFRWRISPKNQAETDSLSKLYQVISDSQAPGISGYGSAFFAFPKIFELTYVHDGSDMGRLLHRFKKSVVTDSRWDFSPMNSPSFYGESGGPESVEFELDLTELELWLSGDVEKANGT